MGQFFGSENIPNIVKASTTSITLAATNGGSPTFIKVAGQGYSPSATLTLSTATSGAGGIDTGSIAANSTYYVYAILSGGNLSLIASLATPSTGPSGFTSAYRAIGLFSTLAASTAIDFVMGLDPTVPGVKANESATFTRSTTLTSSVIGTISSNVRTTDADVTLSISDNPTQTFTGLTTSRAVTLPTTGVNAGDVWRIENTTAQDLVVKSSNGTSLTVANGANIDATHAKGYVVLRALQAAPTTPAHWLVIDLYETYSQANGVTSGNFTAVGTRFTRRMNTVIATGTEGWFVTNNQASQSTSSGYIIARMRPSTFLYFTYRSGTGTTWSAQILTTGIMTYAANGPGGTSVDQGSFCWNTL
jgi:hypothetical protein